MMQDPDHNLVQDGLRNRITDNHHISGDQRPSGECGFPANTLDIRIRLRVVDAVNIHSDSWSCSANIVGTT